MKIVLVAMSGVRARDPELLKLGLTLPGFVERSKTIASLPSLGLLTLAGMTPSEHEVEYIEVDDLPEPLPVGLLDADLVAISTFSAQSLEAYALAKRLVERGQQVVMGGLHVTTLPHEPHTVGASSVVGEGESVWLDILHDADLGALKPIYDARGKPFDIRHAPLPRFELLDMERYNRITIQTSRGCPWKCAFCASSILLTPHYKQKPIDRVLAEVDKVCSLWKRPFIEFADDNSFVNRAYWLKLLPELAKRHIRWFTETDISFADDDELIALAAQAGCAEVLIGFESPTQSSLDGLELHRNWKHTRWPMYHDAIQRIQSHGIRVNACFVLGLDGQTTRAFDDVRDFVEQAQPFDVQVTYMTPFPGTPLYEKLKAQHRLTHDGQWDRCTLFDINYQPDPMSVEELRRGFFGLVTRLYNDSATHERRQGFTEQYRRGPRTPAREREVVALPVLT
ncbi:MAG: radical SAM protein [Phycisphaera sp.]|nr:radical SAM protein [Phycisphaera sp.]